MNQYKLNVIYLSLNTKRLVVFKRCSDYLHGESEYIAYAEQIIVDKSAKHVIHYFNLTFRKNYDDFNRCSFKVVLKY